MVFCGSLLSYTHPVGCVVPLLGRLDSVAPGTNGLQVSYGVVISWFDMIYFCGLGQTAVVLQLTYPGVPGQHLQSKAVPVRRQSGLTVRGRPGPVQFSGLFTRVEHVRLLNMIIGGTPSFSA